MEDALVEDGRLIRISDLQGDGHRTTGPMADGLPMRGHAVYASTAQCAGANPPGDLTHPRPEFLIQPGQLIRHKKFGDGVVSQAFEGGKLEILFEIGPKMLVHGRA